jgi:hypothetical protein
LLGIRYLPDARHVLAVGHPLGQRIDRRGVHRPGLRDQLHLRDVLVGDLDALALQRRVHLLERRLGAELLLLAAQRLAVLRIDERLQVRLRLAVDARALLFERATCSVSRCTSALSPASVAVRSCWSSCVMW